jgi:putative copper resistance protein D
VTLDPATIAILTGATRAVAYGASALIVGAAVFDGGVLRQATLPRAEQQAARARARRIGLLAAVALLIACAARLYIQVVDSYLVAVPTPLMLRQLIFLTRAWGLGVLGQLVSGSVLVALFLFVASTRFGRSGPGPSRLVWIAAPIAALTIPMTGHAISHGGPGAFVVQATHVLAVGSWLGTLAVLWLSSRHLDGPRLVPILTAFSPVALASAAMVVVAGTATLFVHVGTPYEVFSTSYGQVLLVKIALFAATAGVGYANWRHVTPSLARGGPRRQFTRAAALELALGMVAILATALLTSLPQPRE